MKNFTTLIAFCIIAIIVTSCAVRAGVNGSYDVSQYSASSSAEFATKLTKSSKSKSNASASVSNKNTTSRTGFYIGVLFTDIDLMGDKLRVQPELNFLAIKDNLNQFQAPILAKYEIVEDLSLAAGPNIGYLLDAPSGIKSFNLGVDVGAEYRVVEKISISARYNKGLSNLLENAPSGSSVKLNNIQVGLTYRFY